MGFAIGPTKVRGFAIGATKVKGAAFGAVRFYRNLVAGWMDKNGTYQLPNINTATKILGWTPTAGSVVANDALIVQGDGPITVHWRSGWTSNFGTRWLEIRRNGVAVGTRINGTTDTGDQTFNLTGANGDALELWGSASLTTSRTVTGTGYLYYDPT